MRFRRDPVPDDRLVAAVLCFSIAAVVFVFLLHEVGIL